MLAPPTTDDTARAALALARSGAPPGPDIPAGSFPRWTGRATPLTARTAPDLDRVLRHSLAVTPTEAGNGRLRPAPSAGGLCPVDAHLLVGASGALPPGRYAYDAVRHRVHRRGPAPADPPAGTLVVLTVTARRTVSHYGHRALPLLLLDAGHAVAALVSAGAAGMSLDTDGALLSAAAGLPDPRLWQRTWPGTTPQHPLAAVLIGPENGDSGAALARWATCPPGAAPQPDPGTEATSPALERTWRALEATASAARPGEWTTPKVRVPDRTLMSRRSAPPPLSGAPSPEDLAHVLARAVGALPTGPRWCVATGGAHPGLLHLAPDGNRPHRPTLHPLASGEARPTLAAWAAGQGWIAEAGAVLLAYGCPEDADAQRIRRDHLATGYAVGLAQLAAIELNLTSRPLGSWQRADLGAALGGPPGRDWIVHGLALGRGDQP
ncbi:nitroreductase [Streptomyces sp. NPDC057136]|uniref:nitroreductase family protein n=1 Tax=Streptomyces sp. NPDC057136 TaxID=3346029 RepID=UPI0036371B28